MLGCVAMLEIKAAGGKINTGNCCSHQRKMYRLLTKRPPPHKEGRGLHKASHRAAKEVGPWRSTMVQIARHVHSDLAELQAG